MIERVVIDVDRARRSSASRCRPTSTARRSATTWCCGGDWVDVQWAADGTQVAFVSTSRDHKQATLRVADAGDRRGARRARGEGRDVLRVGQRPRQLAVPAGVERSDLVLAERDNWGQLYLHDLQTGKLKHPITSGEGNVTQLLRVDEKNRAALLPGRRAGSRAAIRTSGTSIAIGMDGKTAQLLTPEDADHDISLSPSRRSTSSTATRSPTCRRSSVLRDRDRQSSCCAREGRHLAARRHRLEAAHADHREGARRRDRPLRPDVTGRRTSIPAKKYPIINHIYPGPQTGSVGSRSFSAARGDAQALAELGFVVVEIDGMGTPWRSKKFHEAYYGNMGDNTLPDQVAGMKRAGGALSVDRHRSRRHLRPLRRRLRHGRRDVPLSGLLQGRHLGGRQSRQPRLRRRLGREVAGPAREERRTARPTTTTRRTSSSRRT